jgi:hypothetical protein
MEWTNKKFVENLLQLASPALTRPRRTLVELKLEESSIDPDVWIQGLETLRRRLAILGYRISETDLIIHTRHNLPQDYETTVEFIENELEMETNTL